MPDTPTTELTLLYQLAAMARDPIGLPLACRLFNGLRQVRDTAAGVEQALVEVVGSRRCHRMLPGKQQ